MKHNIAIMVWRGKKKIRLSLSNLQKRQRKSRDFCLSKYLQKIILK